MKKSNIQSITQLLNTLDTAKAKLNPLPISYMADKLVLPTKEIYASMLASFMLTRETISDNETRLFTLLLDSLELERAPEYYIGQVNSLTPKDTINLIQDLSNSDKRLNFIFEALLLARINAPINEIQIQILNQILSFWDIEPLDLQRCCYWVAVILGLKHEENYIYQDKVVIINKSLESDIKYLKIFVDKNTFVESGTVLFKGRVKAKRGYDYIAPEVNKNGFLLDIYAEDAGEKRVIYKYIPFPAYLENWIDYITDILNADN